MVLRSSAGSARRRLVDIMGSGYQWVLGIDGVVDWFCMTKKRRWNLEGAELAASAHGQ